MATEVAYRETEPERRLTGAPGCRVEGCTRKVKARGMCMAHYNRWYRAYKIAFTAPIQERTQQEESPFYADRPCPSCGSRATVPFDPKPERAGRPPSTDLATCVACHHTWQLARSPSGGVPPHLPAGAAGAVGSPPASAHDERQPTAPTSLRKGA